MNDQYPKQDESQKNRICYRDGKFYFTRKSERTFYFILTMIMLVAGILYKTGIF